jgi:hypothetical protein
VVAASVHTVNYDPDQARVRLNLSGFAAGTTAVQVTRKDLTTGRTDLVRGARNIAIFTPASDTVQLYDYEFTPGHTVQYAYFQFPDLTRWTFDAGAAFDVDAVWLKSLTRPYLNRRVTVGSYVPYEHVVRGTVTPAVRRSIPLGGGDVRGGRRFTVSLKLDAEQRDDLDNLLAVGGIWLWHKPGTDVGLPRSGYVQCTRAQERTRGTPQSGDRWLDLTLEECEAPDADLVAAAASWDNVEANYATWDDFTSLVATWNDALAAVADPAEVVVT